MAGNSSADRNSPMGSVDKALRALLYLGTTGAGGQSLAKLSAELELNKASLHRTLSALRHRGFVEQDSSGTYRLGGAILALADLYVRHESLSSLLHEGLVALCSKVNETCHLGVLMGEQIIYIDKVEPQRAIRVWSEIGWRGPAVTTALGRAIMCQKFLDFQSFAAQYPGAVPQRTIHTCKSLPKVWREVAEARKRGFATEEQENELGVACLATAVLRGGNVIAAISITAPIERMGQRRYPELIRGIRECVRPRLPSALTLAKPMSEVAKSVPNGNKRRARSA
jgi:IclR family acetate operon transcriptional repressor